MDDIHGMGYIATYVSNSLHASEVFFHDSIENVWFTIKLCGNNVFMVGCIYGSPFLSTNNDQCELLSAVPRNVHCLVYDYGNTDWEKLLLL